MSYANNINMQAVYTAFETMKNHAESPCFVDQILDFRQRKLIYHALHELQKAAKSAKIYIAYGGSSGNYNIKPENHK